MNTPQAVLDNHLNAFFAGNLDAVLADYGPGSVFIVPEGPLVGPEAIRPFFARLLAEFSKPGAQFKLHERHFHDDVAYITWTAETAENRYEMATDTFVIRDGLIHAQSFAAKKVPKA